jgi:hypothetical protein
VPWLLYTLSVERVLAGEMATRELTFRCIGGSLGQGRVLQMAGAPVIELEDSLVFLHNTGSTCDVAGFDHGMFWIRKNADGQARLVNREGWALGGFGTDDVMVSAERVLSARQKAAAAANQDTLATLPANHGGGSESARRSQPPAAPLEPLLEEFAAFAAAHVPRPRRIVSVNGVADTPDLGTSRAPGGAP